MERPVLLMTTVDIKARTCDGFSDALEAETLRSPFTTSLSVVGALVRHAPLTSTKFVTCICLKYTQPPECGRRSGGCEGHLPRITG